MGIRAAFEEWLASGGDRVGEVAIRRGAAGGYVLTHSDDAEAAGGLAVFRRPEDAREIARDDAAGAYRPLKTAPSLRRGWLLALAGSGELCRAVDFLYPAMLGVWFAHRRGALRTAPLRETLERQSGMYAIAKKLSDADADPLVGRFCRSDGGCLKTILWRIDEGVPITSLPAGKLNPEAAGSAALPLFCHEACNLLVAEARAVVKQLT